MNELRQAIRRGDVKEARRLRALSQGTVTAVVDQPEITNVLRDPEHETAAITTGEEAAGQDEPNHPEHEA